MVELTETQVREMHEFMSKYVELNKKIDDISRMMQSFKTESDFIVKELESVRKKEQEWLKTNAENLGVPVKEFINMLMKSK